MPDGSSAVMNRKDALKAASEAKYVRSSLQRRVACFIPADTGTYADTDLPVRTYTPACSLDLIEFLRTEADPPIAKLMDYAALRRMHR
jgi:hypothetical protein